jgi:hypothetical protein
MVDLNSFRELIKPVAAVISERSLDTALEERLFALFPPESDNFKAIEAACHQAITAGWMCAQGGPGRRFGRVIEAGPDTHGLSVDVVDLEDIVGPHHRHPTGEVCLIMPVTETANFDGNGRGWKVYEPGSAHYPTVTGGEALVLYFLPDGQIEFTD